ncbi:hypothetical protein TNCV_3247521 [Trichonephila clavipes]|nr:hypothetical protein TNCV_3247521 [Trichonephila clavipes]
MIRGPDKLDLTRFSGYKSGSTRAKWARRSSAPRAQNEIKLTQTPHNLKYGLVTKWTSDLAQILLIRRSTSPPVWLVERKERWEPLDYHKGVLRQNWSGTEQNRTVTCMLLKANASDRRKNLALSHDEFCGY